MMVRVKKTPRERLAEEVTYLPEEDWKKVRRYVTMLRRLRRMDYKAFAELVDAGVAEWKDQDKTLHGNDVYCDFCGKSQWEVKRCWQARADSSAMNASNSAARS